MTVGANTTTYNATGLSANTTYYFRVRATNANGDSGNTSTASATTQNTIPAAPSGLTATAFSSSQISLSWTDNSSNETGFKIDQATNSTFTTGLTTVTVGANTTTYSATGLSMATTYYYRVRATNAVGDSANTSTATTTTTTTGTPVAIPVPDADFTDTAGDRINSNTGGGLTFTSPMTTTLSGWNITAIPSTGNAGFFSGWEPYGVLDNVVSNTSATPYSNNAAWIGNQPASNYHAFIYYPGELYTNGSVVGGAQPGAKLTMTTSGISAAAVTGTTYTATIQYANVSWSNCAVNPSANIALNILANGIIVGTGTLSGLAQNAPWTTVTATWTATGAYAGQVLQLQVVATNFLEGPGGTQQWQVPAFAFTHATLTATPSAVQMPTVAGVAVSGAGWASAYSIPVGTGAQLQSLPWSGINQVKVTFNENVTVDQSDLLLTGVNVPSYNVAGGTFSYNATTFTATWTLPLSIGADQLMLALNANGSDPIHDAAGNHLDGEWTNPTSTTQSSSSSYPSGNGTAGGNFNLRFNVLPGDANQDGLVNISDLTALASQWQQTSQGFLSADLNHDGQVNISDLTMLASAWQATLPAGTPAPGAFPAAAPVVVAAATLPAQPALIQSDAPSASPASAALSIPARVTTDIGDTSSQPTASAVPGSWAGVLRAVAERSRPAVDVSGSARLWDNAAVARDVWASSAPRVDAGGEQPTSQAPMEAVPADHASVRDAVLAEDLVASSSSEVGLVLRPARTLESLTSAVDNVLATYNDDTFDV